MRLLNCYHLVCLWFLTAVIRPLYADNLYQAERITENLITFSPHIFIIENEQPCQGILVDRQTIRTSLACASEVVIKLLYEPDEPVELTGAGKRIPGQLLPGTDQTEASTGTLLFSPARVEQQVQLPESWTEVHQKLTNLEIHYLKPLENGSLIAVTSPLNGEWEAGQLTSPEDQYPPGAVVSKNGRLLCVPEAEGECPASVSAGDHRAKRQEGFCNNPGQNSPYFYDCPEKKSPSVPLETHLIVALTVTLSLSMVLA